MRATFLKTGLVMLFGLAIGLTAVAQAPLSTKVPSRGIAGAGYVADMDTAVYIVQLAADPLASYRGGVHQLTPTHPATIGSDTMQLHTSAAIAYQTYLLNTQAELLQAIAAEFDRTPPVSFQYTIAFNGMALSLSAAEAMALRTYPGVVSVQPEQMYWPDMDVSPDFVGAPAVWNGTAVPGGSGNMGEGIIIGIIDTGINSDHPSFAEVGGDGYVHSYSGSYKGICASTPSLCNDKLIGLWDFADPYGESDGPEDSVGHGSHTASTAAGNIVSATLTTHTGYSYAATISGIAPHAHIIAYDACVGGCPGAALIAAVEQAIVDGVDVINYSISGGADPYQDPVELAFLSAADAGIFVAASAGNNGPNAETLSHHSPWLTNVAATTHTRQFSNQLTALTSTAGPMAAIGGKGLTAAYGPAPIVYAANYGDAGCLTPFPAGTFSGQIVICDRGTIARVDKGANVLAGGAGGLILANVSPGETLNSDNHYLPAVHITYQDGLQLKQWLTVGNGHAGVIAGAVVDMSPAYADIVAGFSSRGPNTALDVIKPDIAAPGVDILAAVRTTEPLSPPEFGFYSGTSMASPHVAGAAALVLAVHPGWSPDEVRSALMMTSVVDGLVKEDGVTPADAFDVGAGRLDLNRAAQAGLVLHETKANYETADPLAGGDPTALNVPSMADSACYQTCTFTRTVRSTLNSAATWMVTAVTDPGLQISASPAQFTLNPGETQTILLTADVRLFNEASGWGFGRVILTSPGQVDLHMPLAVRRESATAAGLQKIAPPLAQPGSRITFQIVLDNLDAITHTFHLTDTLPAGLTYVPGSATGGLVYSEAAHQLTWQGEMPPGAPGYAITPVTPLPYQNLGDLGAGVPELCSLFTPAEACDDGYVTFDLANDWVTPYSMTLYGQTITDLHVSANGIVMAPMSCSTDAASCTALPQPLPHANQTNATIAGLWRDIDMSSGIGEWYAAVLNGLLPSGDSVFYVNWHNAGQFGDPATTSRHAVAVVLDGQSEPNGRIYYIYNDITGRDALSELYGYSIGVENSDGTIGTTYAYSPCHSGPCVAAAPVGTLPANGVTLRLDPAIVGGSSAKVFTYEVMVTAVANSLITNEVTVTSDGPTPLMQAASSTWVDYRLYLPLISR